MFASQIKCQKCDLEHEVLGWVEKLDFTIQLKMFYYILVIFISEL